jgi:hypothetical protein
VSVTLPEPQNPQGTEEPTDGRAASIAARTDTKDATQDIQNAVVGSNAGPNENQDTDCAAGQDTGQDTGQNTGQETGPAYHDTFSGQRLRALTPESHAVPDQLGPWRIHNLLGRGGMGDVWRAERCDGMFEMSVAVKIVRSDRADVLERFKQERRVLATLDHPNIARLIDAGVTPDGLPYLVTEFVQGQQLDRWCAATKPKLRERLRLFLQLCDALEYAHSELVVHRDIKPGNILVDAHGTAHLLDFGIAKLVSGTGLNDGVDELTDESPHTPEYAAPEQISGGAITVRTDVYALGLLLYLLLTGVRPQARGGPLAEQVERILIHVPLAPSAALVAEASHASSIHRHDLLGNLDSIVARAIHKSPAQRYASVSEFASDIRAHLAGRPVGARHASRIERVRGYVLRNAALVSICAGAGALVLSAGGLALYQAGSARVSAIAAQTQAKSAALRESETLAARAFISALVKDVELQGAAGPKLARSAQRYAESTLSQFPELQSGVIWEIAGAYSNFALYDEREAMLSAHYQRRQAMGPPAAEASAACALGAQRAEVGKNVQALALLEHAQALLVRAGTVWAELDCARVGGRALRFLGQPERAEAQINAAAQLMRARYRDTVSGEVLHSQYIDILNGLAISQIQSGHLKLGIATLTELGALLRRQGREQSSQMANVYGNMALAQRLLGNYQSARDNAELGMALQRKRDPKALNPSTVCVRAVLAQRLAEPKAQVDRWVALCESQMLADVRGPQLSLRTAWADLAEIAHLRKDKPEFARATAALAQLAQRLSEAERARDVPLWRLALSTAQMHLEAGEAPALAPLLALDARQFSSLAPVKITALALAASTSKDAALSARYLTEQAELTRTLSYDAVPASHSMR